MSATRLGNPAGFLFVAAVDAALICGAFMAAGYFTLLIDPWLFFADEGGGRRLAALVAVTICAIYLAGLYARRPGASRIYRAQQLSLAAGMALLFEALLSWVAPDAILPRNLMIAGIALASVALFLWRALVDAVLQRFSGPRSVLFLGGGETLAELAAHVAAHPELNLSIAGSLTNDPAACVPPFLGAPDDLWTVFRNVKPDLIVAGTDANRGQFSSRVLMDLRFSGAAIAEAGPACELICQRVSARDLRPSRVLFTDDFAPRSGHVLVPLADRAISCLLLLAGIPFALAWSLALAATGNRAIARHECAGYRGAPFPSRRFTVPEWGALAEMALALRLDRYPDLWNVLAGRMSMVGPAPVNTAADRELMRTIPVYEYRRNAKPGLASWARMYPEMRGPVTDVLREIEYDLYYVRYQSPTLYAFVLLHGLRPRMN